MRAPPPLRPPQQARSRRSLEGMGRALESLLSEKTFNDITVAEVVRRAGVSTGSFYNRFAGKDALLLWLEEHYFAESRETMARELDPERWRGESLAGVVGGLVRLYLDFLEKHADLLRPIVLENRRQPAGALARRSREVNRESYRRVVALLMERHDEIVSDDPEADVSFALASLYALSHELILFRDAGLQDVDEARERQALERRLARVMLAYLTCPEAKQRDTKPQT